MNIEELLIEKTLCSVKSLYAQEIPSATLQIQKTRKEFSGDLTIVVFPLLKISQKSPEETAKELGACLKSITEEIKGYNVIKGFLNIEFTDKLWLQLFTEIHKDRRWGFSNKQTGKTIMVEYSSPNTNKPLHLGHIRNNLLGWSVAEILKANGNHVIKTNLVNDRGIHICKSMLAWQRWGNDETPESSAMRGDKFVGKYYVEFDKHYKKEVAAIVAEGTPLEEAEKKAPSIIAAQEILQKWEANEPETLKLWQTMNSWVYSGFDITYKRLGIDFDKIDYESENYILGREIVNRGLKDGVLVQKKDGSVWCDLTEHGLDEKLLLRADGTSVYMTQDIGTAVKRHSNSNLDNIVYIVGNEQDYHFKVLFLILKKLGYAWADECKHLSYGMIDLPSGKMKSREGTVVDADDLIDQMNASAAKLTEELGKTSELSDEDADKLPDMVGMGALKYFILKVDPKKRMLFNPEESIDFNGNTGSFIQYTYARIQSIFRKGEIDKFQILSRVPGTKSQINISIREKEIIKLIHEYPEIIIGAGKTYSPAMIANYVYELAKEYNQFYHEVPILKAENSELVTLRLLLSENVGKVIKSAMKLLGIEVPERM